MFVHDLNQFVTVQLLEETLAVLTQGKLCKDHGYSCEWVSGQEPRLTKEGKSIICKTDNFVPRVVPGLSVNSGSSSSSTSLPQESLRTESDQASGNTTASSSSSSSVFERCDEQAIRRLGQESLKIQNQNKKRDDKKDANDPLADLLFWLEDFKDNLVNTELPAPAHSSRKSIRLGTSCRSGKNLGTEEFGELKTADHKVLNEECESKDNHWYAVVVQDIASQWIQSYQCKTKSSHEMEEKLMKILGAVAQTESCIHRQLDGLWESM